MKTKQYIFLLLISLCLSLQEKANAQTYFNNIYPYGTLVSNASAIIEIDSGGYLFPSCTFGSYNSLVINRINSNGDTLFTKEYYKSGYYYSTGASNSIIKTYDNNYVFSGAIVDSLNNANAFLAKITDSGDTLWTKSYGGANFDNANIVCQTPDSGYVLMGATQSYSSGPASDFYLIKTDKNGNFQWQKNYGSAFPEDCISGQITLDGGYIMSGVRNSQLYIVKADSNGNFQWGKGYAATSGAAFIKQLSDSTYIMVGSKAISGLGYQAYIAKLTKTGVIIWENTYGGIYNQQLYSVPIILNDGSIVCAGENYNGRNIGLLIKTDSLGNLKWIRIYADLATSVDDYFYDVKHTSDNGFVMSGFNTNGWLVKVDSNGCEIANCNVGIDEQINESTIHVYPNPFNSQTTITFDSEQKHITLQIIDVLGKEIKTIQLSGLSQYTLEKGELNNGIYFLRIEDDEKNIVSRKIIIQ